MRLEFAPGYGRISAVSLLDRGMATRLPASDLVAQLRGPLDAGSQVELRVQHTGTTPQLKRVVWARKSERVIDGEPPMVQSDLSADVIRDIEQADRFFRDLTARMTSARNPDQIERIQWMRELLMARLDKRWAVFREHGRAATIDELLRPPKSLMETAAEVLAGPLDRLTHQRVSSEIVFDSFARGLLRRNGSSGGVPDGADFCLFAEFFFAANTHLGRFGEYIFPTVRAAFVYFDHFGNDVGSEVPLEQRSFRWYGSVLLNAPTQRDYEFLRCKDAQQLAESFAAEIVRACPRGVMTPVRT